MSSESINDQYKKILYSSCEGLLNRIAQSPYPQAVHDAHEGLINLVMDNLPLLFIAEPNEDAVRQHDNVRLVPAQCHPQYVQAGDREGGRYILAVTNPSEAMQYLQEDNPTLTIVDFDIYSAYALENNLSIVINPLTTRAVWDATLLTQLVQVRNQGTRVKVRNMQAPARIIAPRLYPDELTTVLRQYCENVSQVNALYIAEALDENECTLSYIVCVDYEGEASVLQDLGYAGHGHSRGVPVDYVPRDTSIGATIADAYEPFYRQSVS